MVALGVFEWFGRVGLFVLGLMAPVALFLGLGWILVRVAGPGLARSEARLKREQAGAERYGWRPGVDTDGLLGGAGQRSIGHDGQLRRMLVGEYEGRRIRMAEYAYTVRGRYLPSSHVAGLVAIELPVLLPDLVVTQGAVEIGLQAFDQESEAFNRQYQAAGHDERYVSAVIHPRMMEWLLANPGNFRIHGNLVVAIADLTPWTVPRTLELLPVLSGIADRIPSFVLSDYGKAVG